MTEDQKQPETPEELISRIQKACREGGPYIFRGTNKKFCEVSSNIYWKYKKYKIFGEHFHPIHIEKNIVELARVHVPAQFTNIQVLTDLRHFDGETTLIDFSRKLSVALFFACNGNLKEDGELIVLRTDRIMRINEIDYEKRGMEVALIRPGLTSLSSPRVQSQNSIFVHAPEGYVLREDLHRSFCVPAQLKKKILDHLRDIYGIFENEIYNDLIGFIKNRENLKKSMLLFYQGLAAQKSKKYRNAIKYYNKLLHLRPNHADIYCNRGNSKLSLRRYEKAIGDYDTAIHLNPDLAEAYNNRGLAKFRSGRFQEAIDDYDEALHRKSDYVDAYHNRGRAKFELGHYNEAFVDFDESILLKSDYADAHFNRGVAKLKLDQPEEAIADFDKAICLKFTDAEVYNQRGLARFILRSYRQAIADYDKFISSNRNNPEAYYYRGLAWQKLNKVNQARENLEKAIKLAEEQGNRIVKNEARKRLRELSD